MVKSTKMKLLTFTAILLAAISMNAQDMFLSWEGETLGDTVTVWDEPDSSEIVFHAVVHNMTVNWMEIKVRRNQVEMVDSTSSYFCWGSCYPDSIGESPASILIPSGGSSVDTAFSGHYIPNTKIGTSIVEYIFYDADNEDQYVKVLVNYRASPQGIAKDLLKEGSISDIYPNPTSTLVNIDYDLPLEIESAGVRILNLFGSVLKEVDIERGTNKLTVDVSDLKSGIYFYTVLINGNLYETKKLIIQ